MKRLLVAVLIVVGLPLVGAGLADAAPAASNESCRHEFSEAEMQRLIALSDPAQLRDLYDARIKVTEIANIFAQYADYRGLFAIYYRDTLNSAIPALEDAHYQDMRWAWAASFDFVDRYLTNLHGHLTGGTVAPWWQHHYAMTADCSKSAGRVLTSALNAHLIEDFPRALAKVGTTPANTGDFFAVGDDLIPTTPTIVADIKAVYGYDMSRFFQLYFVGDVADPVFGDGTTSYVFSQAGRAQSFSFGLMLGPNPNSPAVLAAMDASFFATEAAMDELAAAGEL